MLVRRIRCTENHQCVFVYGTTASILSICSHIIDPSEVWWSKNAERKKGWYVAYEFQNKLFETHCRDHSLRKKKRNFEFQQPRISGTNNRARFSSCFITWPPILGTARGRRGAFSNRNKHWWTFKTTVCSPGQVLDSGEHDGNFRWVWGTRELRTSMSCF